MHRILIVDDEELIVNSLAGYLEEHMAVEIHRAYNAIDAEKILKKWRFSIVITDVAMPCVSGLELLDFIKEYWPTCRVIVLTAYDKFQYVYDTLKYEKVDFILKCEKYELILETIQKRLTEMEQEEYYAKMDEKMHHMVPYLSSCVLERLFERGVFIEQNEMDALEIPLQLKKPLLLVTGIISGKWLNGIFDMLSYVKKNMALRRIEVVFHERNGYLLWILQSAEERWQEAEDIVAYAYEIFSGVGLMVYDQTGESLTLVMTPDFVYVEKLWSVYRDSVSFIEQFCGEKCIRIIRDCDREKSEQIVYPNAEELNYLLTLLKNGRNEELFDTINKEMFFMYDVRDLRQMMPHPTVSAMEVLVLEAQRISGKKDNSYNKIIKGLYTSDKEISGGIWLDESINLLKEMLEKHTGNKSKSIDGLIKWVNAYIDVHYREEISLSSLAAMVNYNPSYLSRLYKTQTGISIITYINLRRVDRAKKLLLETDLKIKDIAHLSGFYSIKHFNQVFKQYTEVSAGIYRHQKAE